MGSFVARASGAGQADLPPRSLSLWMNSDSPAALCTSVTACDHRRHREPVRAAIFTRLWLNTPWPRAPGLGSCKPVHTRPAPPDVTLQAADPAFASRPPLHELLELFLTLDLSSLRARLALGGEHDVARWRLKSGVNGSGRRLHCDPTRPS